MYVSSTYNLCIPYVSQKRELIKHQISSLLVTLKAGLRSCINNVKRLSCNNNLICQTLKFQNDPTWCYVRWHSWWPSSNSWRVVIFSKGLWQRDEHRQKEANTKKNGTLLFVTVFWARDKVRNTPALVRFTTRNRTAPPTTPPVKINIVRRSWWRGCG